MQSCCWYTAWKLSTPKVLARFEFPARITSKSCLNYLDTFFNRTLVVKYAHSIELQWTIPPKVAASLLLNALPSSFATLTLLFLNVLS